MRRLPLRELWFLLLTGCAGGSQGLQTAALPGAICAVTLAAALQPIIDSDQENRSKALAAALLAAQRLSTDPTCVAAIAAANAPTPAPLGTTP